jgi:hypothetical protein
MYCDRCGTQLPQAATFCPSCGKAVGVTPLVPARGRIAGHVRLLGIFWVAWSAIHLIPGMVLMAIFGGGMHVLPPEVPGFVHGIVSAVGLFLMAGSVIGLIAGWGLLQRAPWARMLAIVLGCVNLIHIPFGTALGIYTLWVLLPAQAEQEYNQESRAA